MADLGYIALFLGLFTAILAIFANLRPSALGRYAVLATFILVSISSLIILRAFLTHDFSLEYVASYSALDTAWPYLFSGWWAGNAGSLLFWAWVLALLALVLAYRPRAIGAELVPHATAVAMFTEAFFILLMLWVANPFQKLPIPQPDGRGLNPMLENPGMIFHPPALVAGYAAMAIPFGIAIAALVTGRLNHDWTIAARRWMLLAWLLLGVGNIIGAWWAYVELGWGGYWAWDPVENAGLLPWLTATAFLHSCMAQRRRGVFKVWNMVLVILCFVLAIFGTFLTRSNILSSVHTFGESGLTGPFAAFILVTFFGSLGLVYYRRRELKGEVEIDSLVSRESSFLLNNLLMFGSAGAILLGTMFPAIAELATGQKIEVGKAFFNMVNGPIYLAIIVLAGICLALGWHGKGTERLRHGLLAASTSLVVVAIVLLAVGVRQWQAVAVFSLSAFVLVAIGYTWVGEVRDRKQARSESYPRAFAALLTGNRPRYGGYIVHIGMVLIAIGVAGSSIYGIEKEASLKRGESATIGDYRLAFDGIGHSGSMAKLLVTANLTVQKDGRDIGTLQPGKTFNQNFEQPVSEVAIRSTPKEDLYAILVGVEQSGGVAFKFLVNPLVAWIWVGGWLLAVGGLLAFWPGRQRREKVEVGAGASGGFCAHCGKRYKPGDRFCGSCGRRLTDRGQG